jgi:hypothetical protein
MTAHSLFLLNAVLHQYYTDLSESMIFPELIILNFHTGPNVLYFRMSLLSLVNSTKISDGIPYFVHSFN